MTSDDILKETEAASSPDEDSPSEAKWNALASVISDAILIINDEGKIQEVNPACCRLFGYRAGELLGQNVSILMPEPYCSEHSGFIDHYIRTGEKRIIGIGREVEAKRRSGDLFPIWLSVGDAHYDGVRMFVGIIHDLSQAKADEKRLRQAQQVEAVTQLTAGVAHDFNNLLTVIQGNLEMLDTIRMDTTGQEIVSEVLSAVADGSHLVQQLLAFGRKQVLKPEILDLNSLIRNTVRLLRRTIVETIEIQEMLAPGLPPIVLDRGLLENAILNLVINARDALEGVGEITIQTTLASQDAMPTGLSIESPSGTVIKVTVRDTGTGMSPNHLAQAFEPFFTTKERGKGSGLGLSMVQGFIKQSGGEIFLESELGAGTSVTLYLPASSREVATTNDSKSPSETDATPDTVGTTVLLVEDDPRVRHSNMRRLAQLGYVVLEAQDGESAMQLIRKHEDIALLFSDIVMPGGMLGHELAAKAQALRPDLKVLLTTGYTSNQSSTDPLSYSVLQKPYTMEQLARRLHEVLAGID